MQNNPPISSGVTRMLSQMGHGVHVHERVDNYCVYTSLALEIYMSIEIAKSVYVRRLHAGGGRAPVIIIVSPSAQ